MSKLKYNVKFPCGYEINMEVATSLLDSASGEFDEIGKKCGETNQKGVELK